LVYTGNKENCFPFNKIEGKMAQEEELERAILLIKQENRNEAIPLLKNILKTDRNNERAWLWLSFCVDKPEDKIYCFQEALKINPNNEQTKKALEYLETNPVLSPLAGKNTSKTTNNFALLAWGFVAIIAVIILAIILVIGKMNSTLRTAIVNKQVITSTPLRMPSTWTPIVDSTQGQTVNLERQKLIDEVIPLLDKKTDAGYSAAMELLKNFDLFVKYKDDKELNTLYSFAFAMHQIDKIGGIGAEVGLISPDYSGVYHQQISETVLKYISKDEWEKAYQMGNDIKAYAAKETQSASTSYPITQATTQANDLSSVITYSNQSKIYIQETSDALKDLDGFLKMAQDDSVMYEAPFWRQEVYNDLDMIVSRLQSLSELEAPAGYEEIKNTYVLMYQDSVQYRYYLKE
jgi:tetratricopeptide (TPR) repeat protein